MLKTLHQTKSRQATWLELFFDLIFVAVIDVVAHDLEHAEHGHIGMDQLLLFPFIFIPVWWIWITHTLYANRFDNDSYLHRLFALVIMGLLVILSTFAESSMEASFVYYVAIYVVIRVLLALLYLRIHANHQDQVAFAKGMGISVLVGAGICLSAVFFEGVLKFVIFYTGIVVDMGLQFRLRHSTKAFPVDRKHLVERVSLLAIIILGEAVIGMVDSLAEIDVWDSTTILGALVSFAFIWAIWWTYFDKIEYLERAKRMTDANVQIYSHLILCMGLLILCSLVEHVIKTDLDSETFSRLAITGMLGLYLGKQIVYFASYPPLRRILALNTLLVLGVTIASTLLPQAQYALIGMTLAILLDIFLMNRQLSTQDLSDYLAEHH